MDQSVLQPSVEKNERIVARKDSRLLTILAAWFATLLLSQLPLVIARDVFATDIPWIHTAWIGAALLLFAASFAWQTLRPLRWYFLIMALIILFAYVVAPLVVQSAAWQNVFEGRPVMVGIIGSRVFITLLTLVVLAALWLLGMKRKDIFFVTGEMNAPVQGLRLPGGKRVRWVVFGTFMAITLGTIFFTIMMGSGTYTPSSYAAALPWLPLILLAAAGNAFAEEGMYRAAPLSLLLPVVGPNHAIWMTALWFGFGHFYGGIPSGYEGLLMTTLLGLLLGRAMIDTRGMGWPMIIHIVLDTVIFFFLTIMG